MGRTIVVLSPPMATQIAMGITRFVARRGTGRYPARWCIGRGKFLDLMIQIGAWEAVSDETWPTAQIERPSFYILGIPVVPR